MNLIFTLIMIIVLVPQPSLAQLYKYFDGNNNICFTDDLLKVPKDQRQEVDALFEIKSYSEAFGLNVKNETQKRFNRSADQENAENSDNAFEKEKVELLTLKKELDAWYKKLKIRQGALVLDGTKAMSGEEIRDYNQRVEILNRELLNYKRKEKFYLKKLNNYNQKIDEFKESLEKKI